MNISSRIRFTAKLVCIASLLSLAHTARAALVEEFLLNEGATNPSATIVSSTASTNLGAFMGTVQPVWQTNNLPPIPGGTGACVYFNAGSSPGTSYIQTTSPAVVGATARTVALWMMLPTTAQAQSAALTSWGKNATTAEAWRFRINTSTEQLRCEIQGGSAVATTALNDGKWHHVAIVFPGSAAPNSFVFYVDGVVNANTSGSASPAVNTVDDATPDATYLTIAYAPTTSGSTYGLTGAMADVRIYNTALAQSDILQLIYGSNVDISVQPKSQSLYAGRNISFSAMYGGALPITSTWQYVGVGLPQSMATNVFGGSAPLANASATYTTNGSTFGSVASTLALTDITSNETYDFYLTANNSYNTPAVSSPATLTVVTPTAPYETALLAVSPSNLWAYWRLNEMTAPNPGPATAYDYWGGYNGTYGVNSANGANGIYGPNISSGFPGFETTNTAVQTTLDAVNSCVLLPPLNVDTNRLTIIAWIYPTAAQINGTGIFFCRGGTTTAGLTYVSGTEGPALGYNWAAEGYSYSWNTGITVPINQWSMAAMVIASNTATSTNSATIYLFNNNGVQFTNSPFVQADGNDVTQPAPPGTAGNPVQNFDGVTCIGSDSGYPGGAYSGGARNFQGTIDEVAVFNTNLSLGQLTGLFAQGADIPTGPPYIETQPANQIVYAGRNAQFSVVAVDFQPGSLTYQWEEGTSTNVETMTAILGATNSSLTLTDVSATNDPYYVVLITNLMSNSASVPALLTVLTPAGGSYESNLVSFGLTASNLVAYWRLNETGDPFNDYPVIAYDYWGGFNGVYSQNTANGYYGIFGPLPADGFPGFESDNYAISNLPSSGGYVSIPPLSLGSDTVTFIAWINPSTSNQNNGAAVFFDRSGASTESGMSFTQFGAPSGTAALGYTWANLAATSNWNTGIYPPVNQWSMAAVSVTSSNATVYLFNTNGVQASTLVNANPVQSFNTFTEIGNDSGSASLGFQGDIDEVSVFNASLSASQIAAIYAQAVQVPFVSQPESLILYSGQTAKFNVLAGGLGTLSYQWQYAPLGSGPPYTNLTDTSQISGVTNATLTITNITTSNTLAYVIVVSNSYGSVTSAPATLVVTNPTCGYESNLLALAPGNLIAYWRLNEMTAPNPGPATAYDYWGGFNGTYGINSENGLIGIVGPQPPPFTNFDSFNTAVQTQISNLNSYVTVPALNVDTNVLTILAWINPSTPQAAAAAIFFCRDGLGTTSGLTFYDGTNLNFNWNGNYTAYGWNSGVAVPQNQWSLAALVVTPSNGTISLVNSNGFQSATEPITNALQDFAGFSAIGNDSFDATGGRTFNGIIDEVAIFNTALSLSQVSALYDEAAGLPVIETQPANQTNVPGQTAHFSVTAQNPATLSYLWADGPTSGLGPWTTLTDGGQISGSSTSALTISNVAATNALDYEVIITNSIGAVTSSPAALTVPSVPQVTMMITNSAGSVVLIWPQGTLLQANNLLGPWVTNAAATSPYTITPSNAEMFFKVVNSP